MPNLYRNQTNTLTQISMLSRIRITNSQEAVALLRAMGPLYEQICAVLQRESIKDQYIANRKAAAPEPEVEAEPEVQTNGLEETVIQV